MSGDLKPGLKTKLNSNNNIRDKFSNHKDGKTHGVKNSAGSSASSNLHGMSRTSADWSSKNGSIMGGRHNPGAGHNPGVGHNPGSHVRKQSFNFVSSGWGAKKAAASDIKTRMTTGSLDLTPLWGRGAFTGTTRRALQREFNNNYGRLNDYWDKSGPSTGEKIAAGIAATTAVGSLIAGIVNAFTGSKTSTNSVNSGNGGTAAGSSVTSAISNAINLMKSASNSAELQSAIKVAENETSSIDDQIETKQQAKNKETGLQDARDAAVTKCTKLEEEVGGLEEDVQGLGGEVKGLSDNLEKAEERLKNAEQNGNSVEKAVAQDNYNLLKRRLEAKQNELTQRQADLDGKKKELGEEEAAKDKAETEYNNNQKIITTEPTLDTLNNSKTKLENEIKEYREKLDKMQEDEKTKKNDATNKSTKAREKGKSKKAEKYDAEAAKYQKIIDINNLTVDINGGYFGGHEFKCGLDSNGEMLYAIDGKEVTKDEYNTQLAAAKGQ